MDTDLNTIVGLFGDLGGFAFVFWFMVYIIKVHIPRLLKSFDSTMDKARHDFKDELRTQREDFAKSLKEERSFFANQIQLEHVQVEKVTTALNNVRSIT